MLVNYLLQTENDKWQTLPLVREGALQRQDSKFQKTTSGQKVYLSQVPNWNRYLDILTYCPPVVTLLRLRLGLKAIHKESLEISILFPWVWSFYVCDWSGHHPRDSSPTAQQFDYYHCHIAFRAPRASCTLGFSLSSSRPRRMDTGQAVWVICMLVGCFSAAGSWRRRN
jgi:hypothetical protein